ncbi:site-specific recombinase DNA invertase Pin [Virgisporangium aliadipatigenens]|uniref:Site-specific recombinase DNA invertase Pin n=1 Tax=Virgisporangium aliadipatigenens TaxID=741659 RepID=A0A8J3YL60_9ACTN|nr:recombinase family protein [Virgisporangium aliadipatigenens]GIJ45803.1 site-specific recombinase DNA invertase Pin [Virgisporangium aliadipatigenens]
MRAAIYSRVSSDDERQGRSVGEQEAECRAVAERERWTVAENAAFVDNDRSASRYARKKRPGFADMLAYLEAGEADVLLLWESSRGSRRLAEWAALLDLVRDQGMHVHVVTHGRTYDPRRARDMRSLQDDGVDAEHESGKTSERILRAVRGNAARGRPHGKLLYGYGRRYDDRGQFVEQFPDPLQAPVVVELGRRVLAGESLKRIVADLNAREVVSPGGSVWTSNEVRRVLLNPAYVGKRVHQGKVMGEALWPAILKQDDFDRLTALLTDPRRKTVRDPSIKHMLTGAARCGICDGRMRVKRIRTYQAYVCSSGYCVSIRVESLESFIERLVIERVSRPDAAGIFTRGNEAAERAVEAAEELAKLRSRLDGFVAEAAAGRLTPGMLARVESELAPKIAEAERQAKPVPVHPELAALDVGRPRQWWDGLSLAGRRMAVQALMAVRVERATRANHGPVEDRVRIEWT